MALPLLLPEWSAPPHIRAVCGMRLGGVSTAPYDSLNLGDHVGDTPCCVAANRQTYAATLEVHPVFLNQVHGTAVLAIDSTTPDGCVADACLSTSTCVACTIMVADCLPVLLTNQAGTVVAAAHAGWRGLAGHAGQGVLERIFKSFSALALSNQALAATEIIAWLGPCIGPNAFEVGDDVRQIFVTHDTMAAAFFQPQPGGKWLADLAGLARQRLQALGVTRVFGNDSSAAWCTVANPSRFFSHRRDRVSGRFAVSIWRTR